MFTAALFTIAKLQKQPTCPTTEEWIKKVCLYTWNFIQPQGRMKFCATLFMLSDLIDYIVELTKLHLLKLNFADTRALKC
jgi:hypothetical protein